MPHGWPSDCTKNVWGAYNLVGGGKVVKGWTPQVVEPRSAASSSGLSLVLYPYPSGVLRLATPTLKWAQGRLEVSGELHRPFQLPQWLQLGRVRDQQMPS